MAVSARDWSTAKTAVRQTQAFSLGGSLVRMERAGIRGSAESPAGRLLSEVEAVAGAPRRRILKSTSSREKG